MRENRHIDTAGIKAAQRVLIKALADPFTVPLKVVEAAIVAYEECVRVELRRKWDREDRGRKWPHG